MFTLSSCVIIDIFRYPNLEGEYELFEGYFAFGSTNDINRAQMKFESFPFGEYILHENLIFRIFHQDKGTFLWNLIELNRGSVIGNGTGFVENKRVFLDVTQTDNIYAAKMQAGNIENGDIIFLIYLHEYDEDDGFDHITYVEWRVKLSK